MKLLRFLRGSFFGIIHLFPDERIPPGHEDPMIQRFCLDERIPPGYKYSGRNRETVRSEWVIVGGSYLQN